PVGGGLAAGRRRRVLEGPGWPDLSANGPRGAGFRGGYPFLCRGPWPGAALHRRFLDRQRDGSYRYRPPGSDAGRCQLVRSSPGLGWAPRKQFPKRNTPVPEKFQPNFTCKPTPHGLKSSDVSRWSYPGGQPRTDFALVALTLSFL